jgi:hypothetical protein
MGSNDKKVQLALKEKAEKALAERIATLTARKVTEAAIAKDTVVRHLRADIKALNKRLAAIDGLEKRKQTQAEIKAARAAQPKEKKSKKEKVEAPAEGKKKEKKEKKKKDEGAPAAAPAAKEA